MENTKFNLEPLIKEYEKALSKGKLVEVWRIKTIIQNLSWGYVMPEILTDYCPVEDNKLVRLFTPHLLKVLAKCEAIEIELREFTPGQILRKKAKVMRAIAFDLKYSSKDVEEFKLKYPQLYN